MTQDFWIGTLVGLFIGANVGLFVVCLIGGTKRDDREDEIEWLSKDSQK